jgi:hypothetical protein
METPDTLLYERVPKNPPARNSASESTAAVGKEKADMAVQP